VSHAAPCPRTTPARPRHGECLDNAPLPGSLRRAFPRSLWVAPLPGRSLLPPSPPWRGGSPPSGPRTTDLKVAVTDKDQQQNFELKD